MEPPPRGRERSTLGLLARATRLTWNLPSAARRMMALCTTLRATPWGYTVRIRACRKALFCRGFSKSERSGGEGGIRTPDRLAPMPHFECGAFNHSATSPRRQIRVLPRGRGRVLGEDG